jgi:ABC-type dipeptide/oligopeptide/nickel transport system permease subunit
VALILVIEHHVPGSAVDLGVASSRQLPAGWALSQAVDEDFYSIDPHIRDRPGIAIFLTVMSFNLFGDELRDALDLRSSR